MEKEKQEVKTPKEKKDTKKTKKVLKVILIILACLIAVVLIYEVGIYSDGHLDKSNPMTKEEVVALLEKGKEYPNYYYCSVQEVLWDMEQNRTEYFIKDGVVKVVNNGEVISWRNYNTLEDIQIMGQINGENYASDAKITESQLEEMNKYSQYGFDYSLIADEEHFDYEFEYLGRQEIEGRSYVLVKVWNKEGSELFSTKFLIDEETGLITKRIDYVPLGIIFKMETNRNVMIDFVTDEDVAKPDLTGYKILGENN